MLDLQEEHYEGYVGIHGLPGRLSSRHLALKDSSVLARAAHTAAGLPAQSTLEATQGRGKAQPQLSWARAEVWVGESPRPTTKRSRTHHLALQKHKTNSQRGFSAPGTFGLPLLRDNDTGTGLSLVRAALGLTVFHVLFL